MTRIVAYYRVSTARQGKSGLGLDAQRAAVATYLQGGAWTVIGEFTEVESGKRADRVALGQALAMARLHRCPLVVAKVDRLSRSQSFLNRILDAGVDVRFADLPQLDGPNGRFLLQQMSAVAELEAGMISARTKAALARKREFFAGLSDDEKATLKATGRAVHLGGDRGHRQDAASSAHARAVRTAKADQRAKDVLPSIRDLQARGHTSLRQIAKGLMDAGVPAARGGNVWTAAGVFSVLSRVV